ncbi:MULTISPECIES: hypothetical protein [Acinetobacter]|uniref:Nuclease n=1 Tax=Acinetobacter piscicola TaxID=2006115 RepID=A0A4Q4H1V9_9GAMM|nr:MULTISPECIES: hypothetical protein [Acinetobacter]QOW44417.1 hypothetical protein G0028_07060 [Acinetobacter piscicola]RYL28336.1 hypothetical protein EWP19_03060 [Acinetobacter piscicola]
MPDAFNAKNTLRAGESNPKCAWYINANEPTALDYNEEYKTESHKADFYTADAFRCSDHEPIIVDLDFNSPSTPQKPETEHKKALVFLAAIFVLASIVMIAPLDRRKQSSI